MSILWTLYWRLYISQRGLRRSGGDVYLPKLLQRNGDLDSIRSLGGVEVNVRSFLIGYDCHLVCDMSV